MKRIYRCCLCILIAFGVARGVASAQEEWMPDKNLQQAVREVLRLPIDVPIVDADMAKLIEFGAKDRNIRDLTGLERATNLQWLTLGSNEIQDLSPLAGLTRLKGLWIYLNPILLAFIAVCFARQCVFFANLDLCYDVYVMPDGTNLAKILQIIGDIHKM